MTVGARSITSFGLVVALAGCTSASFTVAPAGDGGGTDGGGEAATVDTGAPGVDGGGSEVSPGGCRTNAECGDASYCAICPGAAGVCRPLPTIGTNFAPVCGCDGITYWNASFAAALNAGVVANAPCSSGTVVRCNSTTGVSCPSGTTCMMGHETAAGCVSNEGTCWRIAYGSTAGTCTGSTSPKARVCGSGNCMSACQAIVEGRKFYGDLTCP